MNSIRMAGSSDVQAIQKISSVVDESQIRLIFSTKCIKAQARLISKLNMKAKHYKERCSFVCAANFTLEAELTQLQQKIACLLDVKDTIKNANIELHKELLMAKENKLQVAERTNAGDKKYEDLWLECKARYESLPQVQSLLQAKDKVITIEQQTVILENEKKTLYDEIKTKIESCRAIDRRRVIELAGFMVIARPKIVDLIKEKSVAIQEMENELSKLEIKANDDNGPSQRTEDKCHSNSDIDNTSIMPRLRLNYNDFDNFLKFDKTKIDDFAKSPDQSYCVHSIIMVDPSKVNKKRTQTQPDYLEQYNSSFFYIPRLNRGNETQNYAKKKLINILENIKINEKEALKMITDANPDGLQAVHAISADDRQAPNKNQGILNSEATNVLDIEEIEEIDLTASNTDNIVKPPTQFLDMTLELQASQEYAAAFDQASTSIEQESQEQPYKKRVTFDLPNEAETNKIKDVDKPDVLDEIDANETINSQLDASDDGFAKIKDMIMKKHNLDLSPQFVYTKNIVAPLNLQKSEDTVVTSKFFSQEQNQNNSEVELEIVEKNTNSDGQDIKEQAVNSPQKETDFANLSIKEKHQKEMDDVRQKRQKMSDIAQPEKPMGGFMFGISTTPMITDSADSSINTTGFEDGDGDFTNCSGTSLLQSPKAILTMPNMENEEVLSQDVPNFLSGIRKSGFSFFGHLGTSEAKPTTSAQNQGDGGFKFNFGGEEKKRKGGLFSMFQ